MEKPAREWAHATQPEKKKQSENKSAGQSPDEKAGKAFQHPLLQPKTLPRVLNLLFFE
jgi:hypothetical protein